MSYAAVFDYPWNIGGRPCFSWPSFIPLTFEVGVLGGGLFGLCGMLLLNRLPRRGGAQMSVEGLPFDGRYQPFWATSRDCSPQGILLFADHWIPEGCLVMLKLHTRLGVLKVTARLAWIGLTEEAQEQSRRVWRILAITRDSVALTAFALALARIFAELGEATQSATTLLAAAEACAAIPDAESANLLRSTARLSI